MTAEAQSKMPTNATSSSILEIKVNFAPSTTSGQSQDNNPGILNPCSTHFHQFFHGIEIAGGSCNSELLFQLYIREF